MRLITMNDLMTWTVLLVVLWVIMAGFFSWVALRDEKELQQLRQQLHNLQTTLHNLQTTRNTAETVTHAVLLDRIQHLEQQVQELMKYVPMAEIADIAKQLRNMKGA